MYENYFRDNPGDLQEYGRSASLVTGMLDAVHRLPVEGANKSLIAVLDAEFVDAPVAPSQFLRNAIEHALRNLDYLRTVASTPNMPVLVPALMTCIRISLLASSHLSYVVAPTKLASARHRMGVLYKLEIESAAKFVTELGKSAGRDGVAGLHPPDDALIRRFAAYVNPYPPAKRISESDLLRHLKNQVLGPMMKPAGGEEKTASLLVDHLFNTTSGAAHGYAWIDLEGVVCNFVVQFSWATNVANVVFNQYCIAAGRHPSSS